LVFHPADEKQFLKQLIERKAAWVKIDYQDGSSETIPWHASRMKPTSNLRANIWSGQLRDWKAKGIVKAEFFIDRGDIQAPV
jgi:hypothetical protein